MWQKNPHWYEIRVKTPLFYSALFQNTPGVYFAERFVRQNTPGVYFARRCVLQNAPGVYFVRDFVCQSVLGVYFAWGFVCQKTPGWYSLALSTEGGGRHCGTLERNVAGGVVLCAPIHAVAVAPRRDPYVQLSCRGATRTCRRRAVAQFAYAVDDCANRRRLS